VHFGAVWFFQALALKFSRFWLFFLSPVGLRVSLLAERGTSMHLYSCLLLLEGLRLLPAENGLVKPNFKEGLSGSVHWSESS